MVTPELLAYIKQQLALGKTKDQIRFVLLREGSWKLSDIDEAFSTTTISKSSRFPGWVIALFVVVLLGGGTMFAAQKYNIHSWKDMKALVQSKDAVEVTNTAIVESNMSDTENDQQTIGKVSSNINAGARQTIEEYMVGDYMGFMLGEKVNKITTGKMRNICTSDYYLQRRKLLITVSNNNNFPVSENDFICSGNENSFVASVPLPGGGYFCIDSKWFGDVVDTVPSGASCGMKSSKFTVDRTTIDQMNNEYEKAVSSEGLNAHAADVSQSEKDADYKKYMGISVAAAISINASGNDDSVCDAVKKEISNVTCFDSPTAWAASYPLSKASGGGYGCVDITEAWQKSAKPATTTVCPK